MTFRPVNEINGRQIKERQILITLNPLRSRKSRDRNKSRNGNSKKKRNGYWVLVDEVWRYH